MRTYGRPVIALADQEREAVEHAARLLHDYAIAHRAANGPDARYVETMMAVLQLRRVADSEPLLRYRAPGADFVLFDRRVIPGRAPSGRSK